MFSLEYIWWIGPFKDSLDQQLHMSHSLTMNTSLYCEQKVSSANAFINKFISYTIAFGNCYVTVYSKEMLLRKSGAEIKDLYQMEGFHQNENIELNTALKRKTSTLQHPE